MGVNAHGKRPTDGNRNRCQVIGLIPDLGFVPIEDSGEVRS